jgi:hypothetical protein
MLNSSWRGNSAAAGNGGKQGRAGPCGRKEWAKKRLSSRMEKIEEEKPVGLAPMGFEDSAQSQF